MDRRADGQTDITGKRGEEKEAMWVPERPLLGPAGVSAGHGQRTAQCGLGMLMTPPQPPFPGFCASSSTLGMHWRNLEGPFLLVLCPGTMSTLLILSVA